MNILSITNQSQNPLFNFSNESHTFKILSQGKTRLWSKRRKRKVYKGKVRLRVWTTVKKKKNVSCHSYNGCF